MSVSAWHIHGRERIDMAGTMMDLAKSTVRLLLADAATLGKPSATGRHQHPFWQLDHCAGGPFTVSLAQGRIRLARGHGILLPPGSPHDFRYPRGARFVSWKFLWDVPGPERPVPLVDQPGWPGLALALAAQPAEGAIPHLLAAAMHVAGSAMSAPAPAGIAGAALALLDAQHRRPWSVASLAAALGLSPGHASARFRAEHGLSLKRWLDARRADRAGQVLTASDLPIAEVAARCGFADPFAFSRYFRRVTGHSPSAFRARALAALSRRPAG
jgi:AraC-like DNA-binding protein